MFNEFDEYEETVELDGTSEEVMVSIAYREEKREQEIEDMNTFNNLARELGLSDIGTW